MMDFNSSSSLSGQITALVDLGMQRVRAQQPARDYLGASRLGAACERALQFEYAKAPVDHGRDTEGRMLRIFERGHVMEDCMVAWLRDAGFDLRSYWLSQAKERKARRIPHYRVGKLVRFKPNELEAWIVAQQLPGEEAADA